MYVYVNLHWSLMGFSDHSAAVHYILIGLFLVLMQDDQEGLIISLCGMKAL